MMRQVSCGARYRGMENSSYSLKRNLLFSELTQSYKSVHTHHKSASFYLFPSKHSICLSAWSPQCVNISYIWILHSSYLSRSEDCLLGVSDETLFTEQVSIGTLCQLLKWKFPIAATALNQLAILQGIRDT
jgi:hypothetical protein